MITLFATGDSMWTHLDLLIYSVKTLVVADVTVYCCRMADLTFHNIYVYCIICM